VTPLGAKGVAEGNAMSTPACIANAVADALGVAEISLPLMPERLLELLRPGSSIPTHRVSRR
jgi:2-furoyl-CoA dehydrogenase large subunit